MESRVKALTHILVSECHLSESSRIRNLELANREDDSEVGGMRLPRCCRLDEAKRAVEEEKARGEYVYAGDVRWLEGWNLATRGEGRARETCKLQAPKHSMLLALALHVVPCPSTPFASSVPQVPLTLCHSLSLTMT